MSKPTVAEVKAELRVEFTDDDPLIERYINAASDSVLADLNWIKPSPPATQAIMLSAARLQGRCSIKLPVRGVASGTLTYRLTNGADAMIAEGAQTFRIDNNIQPNRYHAYLVPAADWCVVLPTLNDDYQVRLEALAMADTPELVNTAIRKCAVDLYRNNGVGTMPAMTAVARLLSPLQDNM